jgi:hypothetical protein
MPHPAKKSGNDDARSLKDSSSLLTLPVPDSLATLCALLSGFFTGAASPPSKNFKKFPNSPELGV